MQQKLSLEIFNLAKKCKDKMKGSLNLFPSENDREIVRILEVFLQTQQTEQNILSKFETILKESTNEAFKKLTEKFILDVSHLRKSFKNQVYNGQLPIIKFLEFSL